jgi:hypothetical protein
MTHITMYYHLAPERRTPRRTVAGGLTADVVAQHWHDTAWNIDRFLLSWYDARYVLHWLIPTQRYRLLFGRNSN